MDDSIICRRQGHTWRTIKVTDLTVSYRCEGCPATRIDTFDSSPLDDGAILVARLFTFGGGR
jgi:hypothetical protein